MKDDHWITISNFACGLLLLGIAAMGLAMLMGGCATPPPPRTVMVPHVCAPTSDSPAFQKCRADCPEGKAFIVENSSDVQCVCAKPPEGT